MKTFSFNLPIKIFYLYFKIKMSYSGLYLKSVKRSKCSQNFPNFWLEVLRVFVKVQWLKCKSLLWLLPRNLRLGVDDRFMRMIVAYSMRSGLDMNVNSRNNLGLQLRSFLSKIWQDFGWITWVHSFSVILKCRGYFTTRK